MFGFTQLLFAALLVSIVSGGGQYGQHGQHGQYGNSGFDQGGRQYRGVSEYEGPSSGRGRSLSGQYDTGLNPETGSRYTARLYTDPEYYGYESEVPGGRAYFKAYRSAPVGDGRDGSYASRGSFGYDSPNSRTTHGANGPVARDPVPARPRAEH